RETSVQLARATTKGGAHRTGRLLIFCTFKAILRGRQGNRETKTELIRRRPDPGRRGNSSGATQDCPRDHRGTFESQEPGARGNSIGWRGDRAPNRSFYSRDRER